MNGLKLLHYSFVLIIAGALATFLTARRGFMHLREGAASQVYILPDDGHELQRMPFYLCLDSFEIKTDASGNITDYISHVKLHDNDGDEQTTISMNNIGRKAGYRIFQTSYDDDMHGSIFTISYDPWGTTLVYLGYAMAVVGMIWTSVKRRRGNAGASGGKWNVLGWILGIGFASYMLIPLVSRPLMPILRHPMLFVHVGAMIISYSLLVVSFFNRRMLRPAVFTMAVGIILGSMWANISWGTYWSWDPKETWALITLLAYAVPLHSARLPWLRSTRNYRIYSLLAFACLVMTYFGVNYLLGGMHSYMGS